MRSLFSVNSSAQHFDKKTTYILLTSWARASRWGHSPPLGDPGAGEPSSRSRWARRPIWWRPPQARPPPPGDSVETRSRGSRSRLCWRCPHHWMLPGPTGLSRHPTPGPCAARCPAASAVSYSLKSGFSISLPSWKEASMISLPPRTHLTSSRMRPLVLMVSKSSAECLTLVGGWSTWKPGNGLMTLKYCHIISADVHMRASGSRLTQLNRLFADFCQIGSPWFLHPLFEDFPRELYGDFLFTIVPNLLNSLSLNAQSSQSSLSCSMSSLSCSMSSLSCFHQASPAHCSATSAHCLASPARCKASPAHCLASPARCPVSSAHYLVSPARCPASPVYCQAPPAHCPASPFQHIKQNSPGAMADMTWTCGKHKIALYN